MAYTQHIHFLHFFLALTACLQVLFTEGRQLKAMPTHKHETSPTKAEAGLESHAKQEVRLAQGLDNHKNNLKVSGKETLSPPVTPKTQSHEFRNTDASSEASSQSTTPGNSPRVGHSFSDQKHDVQTNVQVFTSVAGKAYGFQSTTPGHSPGIGHFFGNLKAGPNG